MYHTFDYQIETGTPAFRIPQRFGWMFYAFWLAFILCLGATFYCQYQALKSRTRLSLNTTARDSVLRQREEYSAKVESLNQSNRLKNTWYPFLSLRPNHARLLAKVLESASPNLVVEKLALTQNGASMGEAALTLNLLVLNQAEEKAAHTVGDFRSAFRAFDTYTLKANTDNSTGRSSTTRLRGVLVNEYHVQEKWVFSLQPIAESDLFRKYSQLNVDFPVKGGGM